MKASCIVAFAVALVVPSAALAIDPRHPDWPCNRIKVPELSVAAFWTGPGIDSVGDAWKQDSAVHDLVLRVAARRTSLDAAERAIGAFMTGTLAEKQQKARLLFAGLFATLSAERGQVMAGIDRYSRRQEELRDKLRSELTELRRLQDAGDHDVGAANKVAERVTWETRVFDERRQTISYVCEVPAIIEKRLFAFARTIAQYLQ
jgi:hypothetical protein